MKKLTRPQLRNRQFNEALASCIAALRYGGENLSPAERAELFFIILRRIEERDAASAKAPAATSV